MAIANPMFSAAWAPTPAELMPTTRPARSTSGPPELPGLMAASVWITSVYVRTPKFGSSTSITRSSAETIPVVTVGPPSSRRA